jgi:hypothetical protein
MHPQQDENTCAVAAIRTVLDLQYDINIDEPILEAFGSEVASPIRQDGAGTAELRRMVRLASETYNNVSKRWRLRVRRYGTRRQLQGWLRRGQYPMVSVMQPERGRLHMMVVVGLPPTLIQLFDPDVGSVVDLPWSAFTAEWAESHWYAVVHHGS